MHCGNCGAEISKDDAYCPYCGVMNARAAEKEYMDRLEEIREDTEKLGGESERQTRTGIRNVGRLTIRIVVIIAAVILGLYGLTRFMNRTFERENADTAKEEAAFKAEYFPKLDALYAEGDDTATMNYMNEIGDRKGASVLKSWAHYRYMRYYMDYMSVCAVPDTVKDAAFWERKYENILYDGIELIYQTVQSSGREMSGDEKAKVERYRGEAEEIFADEFSLSRSDLDEIYESSVDESGYLYWSKIREWAEKTSQG